MTSADGTAPPARAMILAAGLGTRLRPLTDRVPKPLVRVAGYPLALFGIALLRSEGIRDVVMNLHHLGEQVVDALGDGSAWGVRLRYSRETELLDTGGGIRHALPLLDEVGRSIGDERGPIVVANSDVISEVPVADVLRVHRESGARITMVLRPDPRAAGYGLFGFDASGRIRRFLGEGDASPGLREMMFASVHVIDRSIIDAMPAGRAFGTMRDHYPSLFRAGDRFQAYVYEGPWHTADTPADLARTEAALRSGGLPSYMAGIEPPATG